MKRKLLLTVIILVVAVASMSVGVFAASSEYIQVLLNKDVKINLNGEAWQPKDQSGKDIYPLTFEGTTYLPVRAAAEALDVEVGYDASTNTVLLGSVEVKVEADPHADIVMDFVATCLNGNDQEAKGSFMENNADAETEPLLSMSCLAFEEPGYENAEITASTDYKSDDGLEGSIYQLTGSDSDMIILFKGEKIFWIYVKGKDGYNEIKAEL